MNTLIIYDEEGKIYYIATGNYTKPVGLQHLEVEIPEGKIITGVNVSITPHIAIFEDIPKSQEIQRIELLESALNELLLGGV